MSWETKLVRPVVPLSGKPIVTLSDARAYILGLPAAEKSSEHLEAALEAILMAANGTGPIFTAQSAVAHIVHGPVKPLNRGKPDRPWLKRKSRG